MNILDKNIKIEGVVCVLILYFYIFVLKIKGYNLKKQLNLCQLFVSKL